MCHRVPSFPRDGGSKCAWMCPELPNSAKFHDDDVGCKTNPTRNGHLRTPLVSRADRQLLVDSRGRKPAARTARQRASITLAAADSGRSPLVRPRQLPVGIAERLHHLLL